MLTSTTFFYSNSQEGLVDSFAQSCCFLLPARPSRSVENTARIRLGSAKTNCRRTLLGRFPDPTREPEDGVFGYRIPRIKTANLDASSNCAASPGAIQSRSTKQLKPFARGHRHEKHQGTHDFPTFSSTSSEPRAGSQQNVTSALSTLVFQVGCHCWLVQQCIVLKEHGWASHPWHPKSNL